MVKFFAPIDLRGERKEKKNKKVELRVKMYTL
jgi:hypothetical protein